MASLLDIVNSVVDISQQIEDMRASGIYGFFTKAFAEGIKWLMVFYFQLKLQALVFSYDVASNIISSLQLSDVINESFASLDSRLVAFLSFFRIPESINLILSAYTTRIVLSMIGM